MSSANRVRPVTLARASTRLARHANHAQVLRRLPFLSGITGASSRQLISPENSKRGFRILRCRDLQNRRLYGLENLQIPRAPAQNPRKRRANRIARRIRIVIQQSLRGHQNCRRAVPTLCGAKIRERLLQRMQLSSDPNPSTVITSVPSHRRQHDTAHRSAIHQHRASAAPPNSDAVPCRCARNASRNTSSSHDEMRHPSPRRSARV